MKHEEMGGGGEGKELALPLVCWGRAQEGSTDPGVWRDHVVPTSGWSGYFWRKKTLNSTGRGFELRLMPEMLQ